MVTNCLRQILMDKQTLDDYENNRLVQWDDIKRRLLLNEHAINSHIPDHLLRASIDYHSDDINSLETLMNKGFFHLVENMIYDKDKKLYIRNDEFQQWQELLTFCPPLVLIAAFLYNKEIMECSFIKNTALLSPNIKELDKYKGFNDLHIHLNGSTETDIIWQDALNNPNKLRKEYKSAFQKSLVIEQIEQENIFRDSNQLYLLLEKARALRYYIINRFLGKQKELDYPNSEHKVNDYTRFLERDAHPYKSIAPQIKKTDIGIECTMYLEIFEYLDTKKNTDRHLLAKAFHHYLLILGSLNRFVVQQIHQKGFQQFQKITENDLRSISENTYKNRFSQLYGNNLQQSNFHSIEGRFAPKMTPKDINSHIEKIRKGWHSFKINEDLKDNHAKLYLVSHFIKMKDSFDEFYRYEKLRNKLWIQANALLSLKSDKNWMQYPTSDTEDSFFKLTGIDAAASEFDAPPEVFSTAFRRLRNKNNLSEGIDKEGFTHFTFHAGEDFFHIISGLRAIYEAIYFLDLTKGDRIGHATALGISPNLWKERIGTSIYISQGEWLDNLVFILYFMNLDKNSCLYKEIYNKIKYYFFKIYFEGIKPPKISLSTLKDAWLNRKWDPEILLCDKFSQAEQNKVDCREEWLTISKQNITPHVKDLIRKYNNRRCRIKYDKKILIDDNLVNVELIEKVQNKLFEYVGSKGLAIETLPTSNVRIGICKNYNEHHLHNWINEKIITNNPPIVVGSDDTGIFSTNIYNEYAHIYLMYNKNNKAIIKMLVDNSKQYLFSNSNEKDT